MCLRASSAQTDGVQVLGPPSHLQTCATPCETHAAPSPPLSPLIPTHPAATSPCGLRARLAPVAASPAAALAMAAESRAAANSPQSAAGTRWRWRWRWHGHWCEGAQWGYAVSCAPHTPRCPRRGDQSGGSAAARSSRRRLQLARCRARRGRSRRSRRACCCLRAPRPACSAGMVLWCSCMLLQIMAQSGDERGCERDATQTRIRRLRHDAVAAALACKHLSFNASSRTKQHWQKRTGQC